MVNACRRSRRCLLDRENEDLHLNPAFSPRKGSEGELFPLFAKGLPGAGARLCRQTSRSTFESAAAGFQHSRAPVRGEALGELNKDVNLNRL